MKIIIITIIASVLLASCGCNTSECYTAKLEYEKAIFENNQKQAEIEHARRLEIIKATPVPVQVEHASTSIGEAIETTATIGAVGYGAIKVLDMLSDL